MAKSFLKWVGGKGRVLPSLLGYLPPDWKTRRYVEPFMGGASLFFGLAGEHVGPPSYSHGSLKLHTTKALLADVNRDLVTAFLAVKYRPQQLIAELDVLRLKHEKNAKRTYYDVREQFNALPTIDTPLAIRAAMFIYLNKTCFNGLWRVNRKGAFNVPMGRYERPNILDVLTIWECSKLLQNVHIAHESFEHVGYDENDFVYFDPPYEPASDTANFVGYAAGGFNSADQQRLERLATRLHERGAKVLLSNNDVPVIRDLYRAPHWHIHQIQVRRAVNRDASKRGPVPEVVITNYDPDEGRPSTVL